MIATGVETIVLLAYRYHKEHKTGRAEAVLEMLEACRNNMRVVPRVAVKP